MKQESRRFLKLRRKHSCDSESSFLLCTCLIIEERYASAATEFLLLVCMTPWLSVLSCLTSNKDVLERVPAERKLPKATPDTETLELMLF